MARIELIATDLDGTLWDETERIHPDVRSALATLTDAGVPVLCATGRRRRTAAQVLRDHGLSLPGVFLDGSVVIDTDLTSLHRASFTTEEAARVLDVFAAASVAPMLVVDRPGVDLIHPAAYEGSAAHLARNRPWVEDGEGPRALERETVLAFIVIGAERERLRPVEAALSGVASVSLTDDRMYGGATIQVRPSGISKWSGVLAYCDHRGVDPTRVLAVGDAANDIELLTGAAVKCAMGDAIPGLLALADHVLPPASAGGWARIAALALT